MLASTTIWLAGAAGNGSAVGSSSGPGLLTVRLLQLNLCDSGIAGCFTGRSVRRAAAVIRHVAPDVVTLNEVCRADVSVLAGAMSGAHRHAPVAAAFQPAEDRRTGAPFRCLNGQRYGIGVLTLGSAASGYGTYHGTYPRQDLADPEERVWLCAHVPVGFLACTTHTASTSPAVALAQCRFFLNSALPTLRTRVGAVPVVLGADLNLRAGHSPEPQSCLPQGFRRVDDGARQDVIASSAVTLVSRTVIGMGGTTDHPGLLVRLTFAPNR